MHLFGCTDLTTGTIHVQMLGAAEMRTVGRETGRRGSTSVFHGQTFRVRPLPNPRPSPRHCVINRHYQRASNAPECVRNTPLSTACGRCSCPQDSAVVNDNHLPIPFKIYRGNTHMINVFTFISSVQRFMRCILLRLYKSF